MRISLRPLGCRIPKRLAFQSFCFGRAHYSDNRYNNPSSDEEQDFSSIQTMQKILTILHDAERITDQRLLNTDTSGTVKKTGSAHHLLGRSIFDYSLVRYMNDKEFFLKPEGDPTEIYEAAKAVCASSFESNNDSFFARHDISNNHTLDKFQAVGHYFHKDKSACLRRIRKEVIMAAEELQFPLFSQRQMGIFSGIRLPSPNRFGTHNPYVIDKALNNRGKYNILSFLPNDEEFLRHFVGRYQLPDQERLPVSHLQRSMAAYELEGRLLFEFLARSTALAEAMAEKNPEDFNEMVGEFLYNNESLKAMVAQKSKLLSRLLSLKNYRISISRSSLYALSDEGKVVEFLANHFDRFFALYYRIFAREAHAWLDRLQAHCAENPISENFLRDCLSYMNELHDESVFVDTSVAWQYRAKLKRG